MIGWGWAFPWHGPRRGLGQGKLCIFQSGNKKREKYLSNYRRIIRQIFRAGSSKARSAAILMACPTRAEGNVFHFHQH